MPPNAAAELQNVSLVGQKKTAVVVGGINGNGGGIARRLAQLGCSRIIICTDDEKGGEKELEVLKRLAPKDWGLVAHFLPVDLADVKGMRAAAEAIQGAAGDSGIDYLVMSQIGAPTGLIKENADRHDTSFAIQCISRFALAYLLTTRGALAPEAVVLSVYYHWGHSLDDLSIEDLSLKRRLGTQSTTNMYKAQTRRDCTVLDSVNEELNFRYPQYRYYCLWPGLVTGDFSASAFPTYLKAVVWLGSKTLAVTPEQYSNVPVYILASPDAQRTLGPDRYFDHNLNSGTSMLGKWASDAKNREALWKKLKEIIGEKE
ncbi:hypothetical protein MVEN_00648100 [Mycena venus]|uniref:NAD(P)-binding protein n=1 Tax=Mycena venus TaxID=2733690 RepID=A0A8H7D691_9AGAR|nr:hypothetical protein MVEN_00648100 [Mycena venus]